MEIIKIFNPIATWKAIIYILKIKINSNMGKKKKFINNNLTIKIINMMKTD